MRLYPQVLVILGQVTDGLGRVATSQRVIAVDRAEIKIRVAAFTTVANVGVSPALGDLFPQFFDLLALPPIATHVSAVEEEDPRFRKYLLRQSGLYGRAVQYMTASTLQGKATGRPLGDIVNLLWS